MNDFDYDAMQKKRIARGYHNKVRPKRGCTLPSDYLTKKERDKMNGEVHTYSLQQPMSWEQFKVLPNDLKKEYLDYLKKEFNATKAMVSEMFGKSPTCLCNALQSWGIKGGHGGAIQRPDALEKKAFKEWWSGEPVDVNEFIKATREAIEEANEVIETPAEVVEPAVVEEPKPSVLRGLNLTMIGTFPEIMQQLSRYPLDPDVKFNVRIDAYVQM